jgi:hypothetical protein
MPAQSYVNATYLYSKFNHGGTTMENWKLGEVKATSDLHSETLQVAFGRKASGDHEVMAEVRKRVDELTKEKEAASEALKKEATLRSALVAAGEQLQIVGQEIARLEEQRRNVLMMANLQEALQQTAKIEAKLDGAFTRQRILTGRAGELDRLLADLRGEIQAERQRIHSEVFTALEKGFRERKEKAVAALNQIAAEAIAELYTAESWLDTLSSLSMSDFRRLAA